MNLKSGWCYLPEHKASGPQGEDAHFIFDEKNTIGVADGVGGWAKHGIDSGIYAREIMFHSFTVIINRYWGSEVVVNPEEVLSEAYSRTEAEGASTACIITLKDNVVHAVNVGDSGFMIIRSGKTVYKSPVQQKRFNCPYQLGNSADKPSSGDVIKVEVEIGDVIVAGTDGLFDNVFTSGIELLLASLLGVDEPQEVASKIAKLALSNSHNAHFKSPFQLDSMKSGLSKNHHQGGKRDDITVIVSFVMPSSPPSLVDDQIQIQMPSSSSSLVDVQIQMKMPSSPSLVSSVMPSSPPSLTVDQIQIQMPPSPSLVDDTILCQGILNQSQEAMSKFNYIGSLIRKRHVETIGKFQMPSSSSSLVDTEIQMKMPSSPSLVSSVMPSSPPSLVDDDQIQMKMPPSPSLVDGQIQIQMPSSPPSLVVDDQIQIKRKFWGSTAWIWTTIRNQWKKKPRRLALCCCTKIHNYIIKVHG